ncbi:unannotated protein [freshwater metagenome]|uniref:Unannotated protein n=1 Tax=freshwater metagenome TaxID=449393 RepID=A0A6J6NYR3_9ZZZZ
MRAAVLAATRELVAERGPDGFSVRDIAARADVNHALVHRHFGTKADVLSEMLTLEGEALVGDLADSGLPTSGVAAAEVVEGLLTVLAGRPTYWRALLNAVVETPEVAVPGTAPTTELFAGLWADRESERAGDTALAGLTVLGWLIFGDYMADTTGADPADLRRLVAEQVSALVGQLAD